MPVMLNLKASLLRNEQNYTLAMLCKMTTLPKYKIIEIYENMR